MAIRLKNSGTLILVAPKVGGTWMRLALVNAGVEWSEEGPLVAGGQAGLESHPRDGNFVATFVRNPLDWYRSYWAYRMERGWRPHFHLDQTCRADTFTDFVRNVTSTMPGFLGAMFKRYAGTTLDEVEFVGRQETLINDLIQLLHLRGEVFDPALLSNTPPANCTKLKPNFDSSVGDLVFIAEQEMAKRFNYSWPDQIGLGALQEKFPEDTDFLRGLVLWTEKTHWKHDDVKRQSGDDQIDNVRRARCHSNFGLYYRLLKGDVSSAVKEYKTALRLCSTHPRTLANYAALCCDDLSDYATANQLFQRALAARPDHLHALTLYSKFLFHHPQFGDAADYQAILSELSGRSESLRTELPDLFGGV